jgi:polar amino acid transport system substrate-binding protein
MKNNNTKSEYIKSIIGLVLIVAVVFGIYKFTSNNDKNTKTSDKWNEIKSKKTITIGLDDTFVPMGFRDKKNKIVGFDVDLANATFKKLGIKVKWQPIDWATKETELKTGNIDAIWNGYSITPERKKQVAFSIPYSYGTQILVTLKKENVNSFKEMSGKILGVQTGSSGEEDLNSKPEILKNYAKQVVGYDSYDKTFDDLIAGRIQGILLDDKYAEYYISHLSNSKDFNVTYGGFEKSWSGVGFRKSDVQLRKNVNKILTEFKKDGTIKKFENKWFSTNAKTPEAK